MLLNMRMHIDISIILVVWKTFRLEQLILQSRQCCWLLFFLQMTLTHPSKKLFRAHGMSVMGTVHATSTFFPILLQRTILSPTQASRFTPFKRTFLLQFNTVSNFSGVPAWIGRNAKNRCCHIFTLANFCFDIHDVILKMFPLILCHIELNQHNFCTSFFITCHRWTWVFERHYFFVFFLRLAIFA